MIPYMTTILSLRYIYLGGSSIQYTPYFAEQSDFKNLKKLFFSFNVAAFLPFVQGELKRKKN